MREFDRFHTFRMTAVRVWLQVGLFLLGILWLDGGPWIPVRDRAPDAALQPRPDLVVFYGGALLFRQSAEHLYDLDRQAQAQKEVTGVEISASDFDFLPLPYPAVVPLAFVPLTFLEYNTAYFVMMGINLGLLGISLFILGLRLPLRDSGSDVVVLCASASIAVYAVLLQGQVSFMVLLLTVLAITDLRNGSNRSGFWIGLLAFKPILIPVWLYWFAIHRRWLALGYAIGTGTALALISMILVGVEGTISFVELSQRMLRGDFYAALPHDMPTLKALAYFFGFGTAAWMVAVGAVLLTLYKIPSTGTWAYCGLMLAVILVSPYIQPQEMVLLLIVVALVMAEPSMSTSYGVRWCCFALISSQFFARVLFAGLGGSHLPVLPLMMTALFCYCVYRSRRGDSASGRAAEVHV